MSVYHLSQVNIAKRLAPIDDPIMQDFVNNVDRINTLADKHEGFIWRLKDEDKEVAAQVFEDDTLLINMSIWENLDTLFNYTYKSGHVDIFKRKKEWFSKMKLMHMAFWYTPEGYKPTFKDAKQRLDYLHKHGDTPYAFGFKKKFTVKDAINYTPII
ncbi:DUF3291 domain-containing protein [Postechiella marina]|uniref:DUF3291 domain-containing protein n=1 Tax=Postechiella marina TaxID=943941 RepID=A0ABP8BZZ7_9FLAO